MAQPLTRAEREALGAAARDKVPLEAHAAWRPSATRTDPVDLLVQQAKTRVRELVPIRHGRMLVSAFAYFRGAALPMAADLATTPTSGLRVQLCGDAHMSNFGAFASPERTLMFDVNDFDETLPGPFEWDLKRLAASLVVAGRDNGYPTQHRREITLAAVRSYREAMLGFAGQRMLDVWYAHLDIDRAFAEHRDELRPQRAAKMDAVLAKARTEDSMKALDKLTVVVDGVRRIASDPPLVVPVEELFDHPTIETLYAEMRTLIGSYRRTLESDRRHLLDQFGVQRMARKVVGVGSVGTRAFILLLDAGDGIDPLVLQAKEAQRSVLADYVPHSPRYTNQGERVVSGQHLMQAASDIFLGWDRAKGPDGVTRDFYLRQLRDWKMSLPPEHMRHQGMGLYAEMCGWTLARAHARSGDRMALAAYLGETDAFDRALADFAEAYADQNQRDYEELQAAVADGRVEAQTGL